MTNAACCRAGRRGLHRDVVDALGFRIVNGEFPSGTSLPSETEMSVDLDVSRTVVREAVKVLASKGLVESRPKTGTRVLPRDRWQLIDGDVLSWLLDAGVGETLSRDMSELRSLIEPRAAALAARRRTSEECEELRSLLDRMEQAVGDQDAYTQLDLDLHAVILAATHNEFLIQMTAALRATLEAGRIVIARIPGRSVEAMAAHVQVVDAIVAGDSTAAFQSMERLVDAAAEDVRQVLADSAANAGGLAPDARPVPPATGEAGAVSIG